MHMWLINKHQSTSQVTTTHLQLKRRTSTFEFELFRFDFDNFERRKLQKERNLQREKKNV